MKKEELIDVKVPYVEGYTSGGVFSEILINEGDFVFQNDIIASCEDPQFLFDVKASATGIVKKILKKEGDEVVIDDVFCTIIMDFDASASNDKYMRKVRTKKSHKIDNSIFEIFNNIGATLDKKPDSSNKENFLNTEDKNNDSVKNIDDKENKEEDIGEKNEESASKELQEKDKDDILDLTKEIEIPDVEENILDKVTDTIESENIFKETLNLDSSSNSINNASEDSKIKNKRKLTAKEEALKELIKRANNKTNLDKEVEVVFSSITDKINVSKIMKLISQNEERFYSEYKEKINIEPFLIKAVANALDKTAIFNRNVVNVLIEDVFSNTKTIVSNMSLKQYIDIQRGLSIAKEHVQDNALMVVINRISTLLSPINNNVLVFNKIFNEHEDEYMYITMQCRNKQTSVFMNYLKEFIENPGCIIFYGMV